MYFVITRSFNVFFLMLIALISLSILSCSAANKGLDEKVIDIISKELEVNNYVFAINEENIKYKNLCVMKISSISREFIYADLSCYEFNSSNISDVETIFEKNNMAIGNERFVFRESGIRIDGEGSYVQKISPTSVIKIDIRITGPTSSVIAELAYTDKRNIGFFTFDKLFKKSRSEITELTQYISGLSDIITESSEKLPRPGGGAVESPILTPLMVAIDSRNLHNVRDLVGSGQDVNGHNNLGITPLMYEVGRDEPGASIIEFLARRGANVNAQDNNGQTALMYAVQKCTFADGIIDLLVELGADINMKDKSGNTALMHSIIGFPFTYNGEGKIQRLLTNHGAKLNEKNNAGQTALDIARELRHERAYEALMKYGK